jgi:2-succinyl-5-enolpyruvyl-6-hydroxy-3-cyclohexene-1-carboxylate synthase
MVIHNGTEFTSKALDQWAYYNKVALHFITPDARWKTGTSKASTENSAKSV